VAQQVAQEPVEAARGFGFEIRDPQRFAQNMARLVEETGKAVTAFVEPRVSNPARALAGGGDFTHIMNALNQIQQAWFFQPQWRRRSCGSAIGNCRPPKRLRQVSIVRSLMPCRLATGVAMV
jgi:hypothetical protein